jgi:hypothetical protein
VSGDKITRRQFLRELGGFTGFALLGGSLAGRSPERIAGKRTTIEIQNADGEWQDVSGDLGEIEQVSGPFHGMDLGQEQRLQLQMGETATFEIDARLLEIEIEEDPFGWGVEAQGPDGLIDQLAHQGSVEITLKFRGVPGSGYWSAGGHKAADDQRSGQRGG